MSNKLVTIEKAGEKHKLSILSQHLAEHKRLGWKECANEVAEAGDEFNPENATVKEMKKFLDACGLTYAATAKAEELRVMCRAELAKE